MEASKSRGTEVRRNIYVESSNAREQKRHKKGETEGSTAQCDANLI